jgi:hemerythrin superfamily protein
MAVIRGRGMTAFAVGTLAGILASRTLPPIFAQAGGWARGAAGDPFEPLIQDHRAIAALLDQLQNSSDDAMFERKQKLFRLKRRLAAHAMAEEDVIYPVLSEMSRDQKDAHHLYSEHADMKIHLYALEQIPKDDPQWLKRLGELKSLIESHVEHEEEIDFTRLRSDLAPEILAKLSGRMKREKALLL